MATRPSALLLDEQAYHLTDTVLGAGGFATVYSATTATGELVAAKVVDRSGLSKEALARLESERETLLLAQHHPGIVRFIGSVLQVRDRPSRASELPAASQRISLAARISALIGGEALGQATAQKQSKELDA